MNLPADNPASNLPRISISTLPAGLQEKNITAAIAAKAAHITKTLFLPNRAASAEPPNDPTAAPNMNVHTTVDHTMFRAHGDG
ncbi:unnamed protein product [Acanthoscelides obtectus]|nr:unnamed protein product [Acanthoscelides obtectus]CAK1624413.1 hypothetical protein AOBTE_LOCUS2559 [Acanthoscelides obtectus]